LSYILLQKNLVRQSENTRRDPHNYNWRHDPMLEQGGKIYDENYKETMRTMLRQYDEQLPSYIDRIQHEYYILLQVALES
jgi:hypothetical protein